MDAKEESCKDDGLNSFKAGAEEKKEGGTKRPKLTVCPIFIIDVQNNDAVVFPYMRAIVVYS